MYFGLVDGRMNHSDKELPVIFKKGDTAWTAESADSEVAESRIGHNYTFLWPITHTLCTLNQGLALID